MNSETQALEGLPAGACSAACSAARVLRLTLKKRWFDMIARGEKQEEYRVIKPWIIARLQGKIYDVVEFSNGYGANVPKVTVEYLGWHRGPGRPEWGATWQEAPYAVIRLGRVLRRQNVSGEGRRSEDAAITDNGQ